MTSHAHLGARLLTAYLLLLLCPSGKAQDAKPRPAGSISGHVLVNGKGAAGIDMGALGAFGGETLNRRVPAAQTKTDSEGYYHLEGLAAGNYQVVTFTPQLTIESNSEIQFGQNPSAKQILLADGENVTDIDLKLVRGGVITGRVTDADNKPVIEERISVEHVEEPGTQRMYRPPLPSGGAMYQT